MWLAPTVVANVEQLLLVASTLQQLGCQHAAGSADHCVTAQVGGKRAGAKSTPAAAAPAAKKAKPAAGATPATPAKAKMGKGASRAQLHDNFIGSPLQGIGRHTCQAGARARLPGGAV